MKKILISLLLIVVSLSLIGCSFLEDFGKDKNVEEDNIIMNLVEPFWEKEIMYDETVILVAETDNEGNIISAPRGNLLFEPTEIISVKQYFHAENSTVKEFIENVDFMINGKQIIAVGNVIEDLEGKNTEFNTTVPYITDRQMDGRDVFPGLGSNITAIPSTTSGLYLPYTESYHIVQLQLSVTYKHKVNWTLDTPSYKGDKLSNIISKLNNKEDIELLIFGDSISTGSNSSSVLNIYPNLDPWYELIAKGIEIKYGSKVNVTNKSMGGWTSANGVSNTKTDGWVGGKLCQQEGLPYLLNHELSSYSPDLAIIGFGMNDATLGITLNNYASNIKKMINAILERNPNCDIIILGTMLANPTAKDQSKNQTDFSDLNVRIADYYTNANVVSLNIGTMHNDLLNSGKKYMDMTGNNVNHPNDFMARIYAMNLYATLVNGNFENKTDEKEDTKVDSEKNPEKTKEYLSIFADNKFVDGFRVYSPSESSVFFHTNKLSTLYSNTNPSWDLAQWASKYDIINANKTSGNGEYLFENTETTPVSKKLYVNTLTGRIDMAVNASVEYDHDRKDGESWPHLLLGQDFSNNLVNVSECEEVLMNISFKVNSCENYTNAYNTNLHCAQFVWYFTLQNRNQSSEDFGKYIWFGLNLYDNRMEGKVSTEFASLDGGKASSTNAFIYQPSSSKYITSTKMPCVGEKCDINFNIMEVAEYAFNLAKDRGYLGTTTWEEIYIGSTNFGFEVTGTFDIDATIYSISATYLKK